MAKFYDGLKNLISDIANRRNAVSANAYTATLVPDHELRALYRSGLGNKIIRIKNSYSLKEDLIFEDTANLELFNSQLLNTVRKAGMFMLGFGRSLVLINERGADLSTPASGTPDNFKLDVFSGDMVSVGHVSVDLADIRYNKPREYNVRGVVIHHSRVVDFTYVAPPDLDLPSYKYGGIPELELVYAQLVNDAVVERASASIIDKNSTLFYKIKDFKQSLRSRQEKEIVDFYKMTEDARSIFGAGLIDADDDVINIDQTLTNLDSVDQISLRRLAMVTGIGMAILVGESFKGMNSTGTTEKLIFNEMIENLQNDYYLQPINELCLKTGLGTCKFSNTQNLTPTDKIEFEAKAILNAKTLWEMGEDSGAYLEEKEIVKKDDFAELFSET